MHLRWQYLHITDIQAIHHNKHEWHVLSESSGFGGTMYVGKSISDLL